MKPINFESRVAALAARLKQEKAGAYVGTRQASLHYLCGTFMPWRGAVIVTQDGSCEVIYWAMDSQRIREEGCPHPIFEFYGAGLIKSINDRLRDHRVDKTIVGLDLSHPGAAQVAPGMLTAGEYLDLSKSSSGANFVNGVRWIDDLMLTKSEAEIERLRRAAEVAALGFNAGKEAIKEGVTENHIAGVVEAAIRDHGSTWSWSVTGGTEVGGGERTAFLRGVTQQSTDRKIKRNEFVVIDLHPLIDLYMSDLSIPIFFGQPGPAQRAAIDCWEDVAATLLDEIKPGKKVSECVQKGISVFERHGLGEYGLPLFGHGLGTCARTRPFMNLSSDDILHSGMVIALGTHLYQPGVGGLRLEYPILVTPTKAEPLAPLPAKVQVIH